MQTENSRNSIAACHPITLHRSTFSQMQTIPGFIANWIWNEKSHSDFWLLHFKRRKKWSNAFGVDCWLSHSDRIRRTTYRFFLFFLLLISVVNQLHWQPINCSINWIYVRNSFNFYFFMFAFRTNDYCRSISRTKMLTNEKAFQGILFTLRWSEMFAVDYIWRQL